MIDIRETWFFFRNHLWKIVLFTALGLGAALLYLHYSTPTYTSSALLEVTQGDQRLPMELESSDSLRTLELKIASRPVLSGVVKAQNLLSDPEFSGQPDGSSLRGVAGRMLADVQRLFRSGDEMQAMRAKVANYGEAQVIKDLAGRISVNSVRGSRLITLSARASTPETAQHLAQAVIDEFYAQSRDQSRRSSSSSRALLMTEAKRVGDELRASEEKLQGYRNENNAVSLQDRQNIVVERLRDLNQQVAVAKNARVSMESEQARMKGWVESDPDQLLSIRAIADLPEVGDLRRQLTLQETQVATLAQRYGPLHPTMIQAKSQSEQLRSALRGSLRKAYERVVQTYETTKGTEEALVRALAEQEKASLELDRIAIPYRSIEREVQANSSAYQKILESIRQADMNRGMLSDDDADGIDIRTVEKPVLPLRPSGPRSKLILALLTMGGLFVGCGTALFSRAIDNSITSVDDAESTFGLPVLSTVPRARQRRRDGSPSVMKDASSAQAEAFRSLRTAMSLRVGDEARRCVLFTSAIPGEGKSFCSVNYAASLAQQGYRTLLVDGDLRRPSLGWLFADKNDKPTLSAVIRQPDLFAAAVQPTRVENLFRLGDWEHQAGSSELLSRYGLRDIVRQGLAGFDRVVIDSAPLMPVSDTLFIACDAPIICMVVSAGTTSRRLVRRALRMLEQVTKTPATGIVLNKVTTRSNAEHYYYYNS